MRSVATFCLVTAACATASPPPPAAAPTAATSSYSVPEETHLPAPRRLTDGGENAEAYWSFDGQRLSFVCAQPGLRTPARELDVNHGKLAPD